tara:strand:- start:23 stop:367 length:345 start_codon:yes stop_codon:yes gene_type:complete
MSESAIELQMGEDYNNQYESCKDDALQDFFNIARGMSMDTEHLVPFDAEGPEVYHIDPRVAATIDQLTTIGSWYIHTVELEGKYCLYEENFIYDFQEEAKEFLRANLGYYTEET